MGQHGSKTSPPNSPHIVLEGSTTLKEDPNVLLVKKQSSSNNRESLRLSVKKKLSSYSGEYREVQELGAGITGTVYLVKNKQGQQKAMKTINVSKFNRSQLQELRTEIGVLEKLDHPNVVRLLEVFEDSHSVKMVMDLCLGGNLASSGARSRLRTEGQVASVIYQLFLAIKYIHEQNIVHRDIKLENIMFEAEDENSMSVKLIDFGLCGIQRNTPVWSFSNKNKTRLFATTCGTTFYMAPEVIDGKYDSRCDIWSLGVLMFLLLTGKPPFYGENEKITIQRIQKARLDFSHPIWEKLSPYARELVEHLLVKDPSLRWTAEEALRSHWFDDCREQINNVGSGTEIERDVVRALERFVGYGKLKKTAMLMIAHNASGTGLKELQAAFTALDKDHSGTITFNELKSMLLKHNLSEDAAAKLFQSMDVDDSGEIQLTEFLAATLEATCKIDRELMAEAFDRIAKGGEYITTSHLDSILGKTVSKAQIQEMIKSVDKNNDGKISREEFLALVEENQEDTVENFVKDNVFVEIIAPEEVNRSD